MVLIKAGSKPLLSQQSVASRDPLLQPFHLKHLRLRNRLMISAHEPAYPEDGMPKAKCRAYHIERTKAGIALAMTAGSVAPSRELRHGGFPQHHPWAYRA